MSEQKARYHLQKIIQKLREFEYTVRFEKGNFKTGFCILEEKKVVVVNQFHDVHSRLANLQEILGRLRK